MLSRDVPEDGPRSLPPPVRTRYAHGDKRTAGWYVVTEIQCPRDHHIRDGHFQIGHSTFRCAKCGVLMWALFVAHSHLCFLAEVDAEDVRRMKELTGLLDVLRYLDERIGPVRSGGRAA